MNGNCKVCGRTREDHCKDIRVNLTDDEIDHLKNHGFLRKFDVN